MDLASLTINSTNPHKLAEYGRILGRSVEGAKIPTPELQMESGTAQSVREHRDGGHRLNNFPYMRAAAELAAIKAQSAHEIFKGPVLIEDTALFLHGLCGEPGPFYSQWGSPDYNGELCNRVHLLPKLVGGEINDRATALVSLAMWSGDPERPADVWQGVVAGIVPDAPRGEAGFGWDSIFIPLNEDGLPAFIHCDPESREPVRDELGNIKGKTFAELTPEEKDAVSMRVKALRRFLSA